MNAAVDAVNAVDPVAAQVRVVADRGRCVGAGQCVLSAPAVFDQSEDDGRVVLRDVPVSAAEAGVAVALCPSRALSLSA